MMVKLQEEYKARPIRFLELWEIPGWRLKVYGICYQSWPPHPELIAAAKTVARRLLSGLANDHRHYGVGFVGAHQGRSENFVFVDWWADENELHHHVYTSTQERPQVLKEITSTGLMACVWDLRVLAFEREAWLNAVLKNPSGPDLEGYLRSRLDEEA